MTITECAVKILEVDRKDVMVALQGIRYKRRWKMTAVANKNETETHVKPRRFWWAKGHPPE